MSKRTAEGLNDFPELQGSPTTKRIRLEDETEASIAQTGAEPSSSIRAPQDEDNQKEHVVEAKNLANNATGSREASPESEEDDRPVVTAPTRQAAPAEDYTDLYLDTIQRAVLDFDFEKLCSVSLSNINVYACLVCGKYFQGRGPKSHAYFHALDAGHHVYINMETKKVYVLPEGYEVKNKSLDDVKYVVDPYYSKEEVAKLDKVVTDAWDLAGKRYRPGMLKNSSLINRITANFNGQALWE